VEKMIRTLVMVAAFFIATLLITVWRRFLPGGAFPGGVMALIVASIVYGAWEWSKRFR